MASLLKSLRWLARDHSDLVTLASRLNDEIKVDLLSGQFITGAFIALDNMPHTADLLLMGHHPFVLVDPLAENMVRRIGRKGMALGLVSGSMFARSMQLSEVVLVQVKSCINLPTAWSKRLIKNTKNLAKSALLALYVSSHSDLSVELNQAVEHVIRFADGDPADDLSIVVLSRDEEKSSLAVPATKEPSTN